MAHNVFGETLIPCGTDPMTGFFRTGTCDTCAVAPPIKLEATHASALEFIELELLQQYAIR